MGCDSCFVMCFWGMKWYVMGREESWFLCRVFDNYKESGGCNFGKLKVFYNCYVLFMEFIVYGWLKVVIVVLWIDYYIEWVFYNI